MHEFEGHYHCKTRILESIKTMLLSTDRDITVIGVTHIRKIPARDTAQLGLQCCK